MAKRLSEHHIRYDPYPWTVILPFYQHKVITIMQRTKGTPEKYAEWTDFLHAVFEEWQRMRAECDTGLDLRIPQMKKQKDKKNDKKSN